MRLFISTFITIIILLLSGCGFGGQNSDLLSADAVIDDNPDSAMAILSGIPFSDILRDKDKALYTLLYNQAKYKLNRHTSAKDLDFCVSYYQKHQNPELLLRSYYYRGAINEENGDVKKALGDYKEAEKLVAETGNHLMAARIYEALSTVNYNFSSYKDALSFAKKELEQSCLINDTSFIALALNNIAVLMPLNEKKDSAEHYIKAALAICSSCDGQTKSTVYSNVADYYWEHEKDYEKAEMYYKKAIAQEKSDNTLFSFVCFLYSAGNYSEFVDNAHKLLESRDNDIRMSVLELLCQYNIRKGNYEKALDFHYKADSILDSKDYYANKERIKEIQAKFDYNRIKSEKEQDIAELIILSLAISTVFSVLIAVFFVKMRNRERRIRKLEKQLRTLDEETEVLKKDNEKTLKEKMNVFQQILKEKQSVIAELDRKVSNYSSENKNNRAALHELSDGLKSLYLVIQGGKHILTEKIERENFIRCYGMIDEEFLRILDNVPSITVGDKLLCILFRMEKTTDEIQYILGMSGDAYRKAKSRLLNKLKKEEAFKPFCDKIG